MLTTGEGVYRVSVVLEKIDPATREVLDSRKYRGIDLSELPKALKVLETTAKARDRAETTHSALKI